MKTENINAQKNCSENTAIREVGKKITPTKL